MTKIQANFRLEYPLDEALLLRIRDAQAIYGIDRIQLAKTLDGLRVDYDATRFTPADLESTLKRCGLPIAPVLPVEPPIAPPAAPGTPA